MAQETLKDQERLQNEQVAEKVSSVEKFFNENKKVIWGCLGAVIVVGVAVLCYQKFYAQPQKAEAAEQMYQAEANFRAQNYDSHSTETETCSVSARSLTSTVLMPVLLRISMQVCANFSSANSRRPSPTSANTTERMRF